MVSASVVTAAKPEDVGIDSEKLEMVFARAKRDVDQGILPSCQVAVARQGKLAGMRTFGSAVQGGAEKPATDETLYHFFSSTKAVVAAAVWLLFEDGVLRLDEKVADIIPEFGTNGKDVIDIETLMLHAGGFPLAPFKQDLWTDRAALLRAFSQWRLNWPVDSKFEYHATSMHWVLSEIIERRGGLPWKRFIQERVHGADGARRAVHRVSAGAAAPRCGHHLYGGAGGAAAGVGRGDARADHADSTSRTCARRGCRAAGRWRRRGSMALFYQTLINGGVTADGTRVMKAETIEFGTKVRSRPQHIEEALRFLDPEPERATRTARWPWWWRATTGTWCTAGSGGRRRRGRSVTAARAGRSRSGIRRRGSASGTARTASAM